MPLPAAGSDPTAAVLRLLLAGLFDTCSGYTAIATDQGTSGTAYGDLASVGPTVTLTSTGTRALVVWGCGQYSTNPGVGSGSTIAVSGATTLAAADTNGVLAVVVQPGTGLGFEAFQYMFLTISPGVNNYVMKYRSSAASNSGFYRRRLLVVAP